MIILLDMDNVAADLMKKWLNDYNTEYNDSLTGEDMLNWDMSKHAKCTQQQFHSIVDRPGYFADLEVMADAVEVTRRLQEKGHEIFFVTATPHNNPTGGYDKYQWVEKHFPHIGYKRVIQAHIKNMVKGDLLFDDSPTNLREFPGIKVVMDVAYNRDAIANYRVHNWLEFEKVVEQVVMIQDLGKTFA